MELAKCGVPPGSTLAPLLFRLYINDFKNVSSLFDSILFEDNTNLFYSNKNITCLFSDVKKELTSINKWFVTNKLSLNDQKNQVIFFLHKHSKKDDISLQLPNLTMNNQKIKREEPQKFLGVLLDEKLTWKEYLKYIENKCAKILACCAKQSIT